MTKQIATLVWLVAMVGPAHAEMRAGFEVGRAVDWIKQLRQGYDFISGATMEKADNCDQDIADARKNGLKVVASDDDFKEWGGKYDEASADWLLTLDQAAKVCAEARLWSHALIPYGELEATARIAGYLDDESMPRHMADAAIEQADKCDKIVADFAAKKIPTTWPYPISNAGEHVTKTVADIKPKLCEPSRKVATKFAKDADERQAKIDAEMKKAGITGEKREWWDHYHGNIFLAGGKTPSDLKQYGKAALWFQYTHTPEPDSRGNYSFEVRRYQWKGTKLVKSSHKTYQKPLSFKNSIGSVMK